MKRLGVLVAAALALALAGGHGAPAQQLQANCSLFGGKAPLWLDFADGSVPFWNLFARPGVTALASNLIYPPKLRDARRADRLLRPVPEPARRHDRARLPTRRRSSTRRTSSTTTPPVDGLLESGDRGERALRVVARRAVVEDERAVPRERAPLPADARGSAARSLGCSSTRRRTPTAAPATGGGRWPTSRASCARSTSRPRRSTSRGRSAAAARCGRRSEAASSTSRKIGIPVSKLGVFLGFQTTKGSGGREGLEAEAWFRTVKWQALAARYVAERDEVQLDLVVGLGGVEDDAGRDGPGQADGGLRLPLDARARRCATGRARRERDSCARAPKDS